MKSSLSGIMLAAALSAGCNDGGRLNIDIPQESPTPTLASPTASPAVGPHSDILREIEENHRRDCREDLPRLVTSYRSSLARDEDVIAQSEAQLTVLRNRMAQLESADGVARLSLRNDLSDHRFALISLLGYVRSSQIITQGRLDGVLGQIARCSDAGR